MEFCGITSQMLPLPVSPGHQLSGLSEMAELLGLAADTPLLLVAMMAV